MTVPTIARIRGQRFFFFSNEGQEPPHVHVRRERKRAKFWLDPVALDASAGYAEHELRSIERLVVLHRSRFLEAWDAFFGR